jgi:hypothetical protein
LLLSGATIILIVVAVGTLWGGIRQLARSETTGQRIETVIQLACGALSLLAVLTCYAVRRWASPVRIAWATSLGLAAGLSSVVWGPPMVLPALVFVGVALLGSFAVIWALRTATAE